MCSTWPGLTDQTKLYCFFCIFFHGFWSKLSLIVFYGMMMGCRALITLQSKTFLMNYVLHLWPHRYWIMQLIFVISFACLTLLNLTKRPTYSYKYIRKQKDERWSSAKYSKVEHLFQCIVNCNDDDDGLVLYFPWVKQITVLFVAETM